LFIALNLPDDVRAALRTVQDELREIVLGKSVAWTRPEAMHLTLRFLGNVDAARVPGLSQRLHAALAGFGGCNLVCERLGCFPDLRYPRVVWAGVTGQADALTRLFHRVNEAVSAFAERPAGKRFTGHVTLARLKQIQRPDAERLATFITGAAQREFGDWTARSVSLMQSQLTQTGAIHTELGRAALC